MSATTTFSVGSALKNYEIYNTYETKKNDVYLWGVRGNSFVLITKQDGFLRRIWNLFLSKLRFIKTDQESIQSLHQRSIVKLQSPEAVELITEIPHAVIVNAAHYLALNKHIEILRGQTETHGRAIQGQNEVHAQVVQEKDKELNKRAEKYETLSSNHYIATSKIQYLEEAAKESAASLKNEEQENNRIRMNLLEKTSLIDTLKSELSSVQQKREDEEKLIGLLRNQLSEQEAKLNRSIKSQQSQNEVTQSEREHFVKEKDQLLSRIYMLAKENELLANKNPQTIVDAVEAKDPIDMYKYNFEQWRKEHESQLNWVSSQRDNALKERNQLAEELKKLRADAIH